jgi:anthranilate synthase/aminodeoxychorismate synthase-like glutamine amidotransferase
MILIIDNYDSFVHNLARHVRVLGLETQIVRNDKISVQDIINLNPTALLLSPGPCGPEQAGICMEAVRIFAPTLPILGVCLGHQVIAKVFGGEVGRASKVCHGKSSLVHHCQYGLFSQIPSPFRVGRYHSLETKPQARSDLVVLAHSEDDVVMAVEHKKYPCYGVQFHPESILTEHGFKILSNFFDIAQAWHGIRDAA